MKSTREESVSRTGEPDMGGLKELYEQARPLSALTEVELRRVRRRVRQTILGQPSRPRAFRFGTALTVVTLLLLGGMGYAAADRLGWVPARWKDTPPVAPGGGATSGAHARRGSQAVKPPTPAVAIPLPTVPDPLLPPVATPVPAVPAITPWAPAPIIPAGSPPTRRRASLDPTPAPLARRPTTDSPPSWPTPSGEETPAAKPTIPEAPPADLPESPAGASAAPSSEPGLLRVAMRKLRHENDPAGALAVLSEVATRFPAGPLAGERAILEVEALLGLRREAEALAKLDGMNLGELPRSGERFVLRGELRARARRHAEAAADFDRALSRVSGSPAWHERALWGRAVSRLNNQERQLGIADLEDYLEQYPKGGHAAEANALLRTR